MIKKKKVAKPSVDTAPLSFEKSLARIEAIVADLESGQLGLTESLARYEEGIGHLKQCQKQLERAELKVAMLTGFDADGNPITQEIDAEELTLEEKAQARSRRRSKADSGDPSRASEVDGPPSLF